MIGKLTFIELEKLFRRGRTYIGFAAVILIVIIIQAGMALEGENLLNFISESLERSFVIHGNLLNGYLISYLSINSLWIHIPILVVIVAGDLISGETNAGTFRLILTRPVTRMNILTSKFLAGMVYIAILICILGFLSLGLGIIFFGEGDLVVILDTINIIPADSLIERFIFAFSYGMVSMFMVGSLSFLFSVIYNNSITPIILSMSIIILFTIVTNFEIGIFEMVRPYLFTEYINNWRLFFDYELNHSRIVFSLTVMLIHIGILYLLSIIVFNRKDITS